MTRLALAISPHLDDAAFSCGGTLARLAAAGWRVVIATVFTASAPDPTGFALACQLDKGLGPEVDYMALRREEDRAAASALDIAPPVWLGLREAPHRDYGSPAALFGPPLPEDEGVVREIAGAVERIVEELRPGVLLAPQAIGAHVDHVQVVRALNNEFKAGLPCLWWRDFPYVVRETSPAEPFGALFASCPELSVELDPLSVSRKRAGCLAYASQLGFQFGGPAGLEQRLAVGGDAEVFRVTGELSAFAWGGRARAA